jgi:hypothetical protein
MNDSICADDKRVLKRRLPLGAASITLRYAAITAGYGHNVPASMHREV